MHAPRRHDLDALRVIAFGLLILYHCGMLYVAEWDWHIKSSTLSEPLQWVMLFTNRWRMALLFVISGIAATFLLQGMSRTRFIRQRTLRLVLPLVFGMFVVLPVQPWVEARAAGAIDLGFGEFLLRYWRFDRFPVAAWDGRAIPFTWNHLWYLAYLWVYTVMLAALLPVFETRLGQRLRVAAQGLRGGALLLVPGAFKTLYLAILVDRFPGTNALIDDWYQHALYFTYFLFGYLIGTDTGFWDELKRLRHRLLGLALFNWLVYVVLIEELAPDDLAGWPLLGLYWISGLNTWLGIATALAWSYTLLNRPWRWLPYAREAVYPWYVLHQSILIALAFWLVPLKLGGVVEPLLVILGTVLGCALLHELLIRRSAWLRPFFGLPHRPRNAPPLRNDTGFSVPS